MKLRRATTDDAAALASLHRSARTQAMPWLPILHSLKGLEGYLGNRVIPNEEVWVALDGAQITGFIAIEDDWIDHLYIAPSHWRQGIGSALMAKAKAASPALQLWAFQGNGMARSFYAMHGFDEVELTDGENNEEKTPDVRMAWQRV